MINKTSLEEFQSNMPTNIAEPKDNAPVLQLGLHPDYRVPAGYA